MYNVALNLANAWGALAQQAVEYAVDASQRSILYADAMRKRGNLYLEHGLQGKPPLLKFKHEVVIDGRSLAHPCNYSLLHILPEPGFPTDGLGLVPVAVDTWGPFVFVNAGAEPEPLANADRKSTRLNSSHYGRSRMPSSA